MNLDRAGFLKLGLAALCGAAIRPALAANGYPNKPIKLVVPFPPGGTTDIVARIVAQRWSQTLGQPIIVENKAGSGGNIGADSVAKSPADGYTLLYGTVSNFALNIGLYKKLPYSPLEDLVPVGMVAQIPIVLVVSPTLGVKDYSSFIKLLKANPGKFNYGSAGNGSSAHIACHLLLKLTGTDALHVPYKGNAPALQDIMAGSVAFGVASVPAAEPLVKAGRLVAIAAVSEKRLEAFPALPTTQELGLKDFDAYSWNAIAAPAGTPASVLDALSTSLRRTVKDKQVNLAMEQQGVVPLYDFTRAETAAYFKAQADKWVPIVRASGAQVD